MSHPDLALARYSLIQTCYQVGTVLMMAVGILAAIPLSPTPTLQALPLALTVVGNFMALFPASHFMARFGRKAGLLLGIGLGALGVLGISAGLYVGHFWIMAAGFLVYGFHQAFMSFLRFMAMEAAGPERQPRALSWILLGGIPAAFIGPLFGVWGKGLFPQAAFLGSFLLLLGVLAFQAMLAATLPGGTSTQTSATHTTADARPWGERLSDGSLWLAVLAASFSFAIMVMLMAASPVAMIHHGHTQAESAMVLQAHVLGMYVPSFFSGALVKRFGPRNLIFGGLVLFALEMVVASSGDGFFWFLGALTLLGVGWNFLYVGGTHLLVSRYRPAEKAGVQAFNDSLVSLFGATATFSAGALEGRLGWVGLQFIPIPLMVILGVLLLLTRPKVEST